MAFSPAHRVKPKRFVEVFTAVLAKAVEDQGLFPTEWAVDFLPSREKLSEYLRTHHRIYLINATIKLPNPGLNLEGDIAAMRELGAPKEEKIFHAPQKGTLRPQKDASMLEGVLAGLSDGDVELRIRDRSGENYSSEAMFEEWTVEDWEDDLNEATATILDALKRYADKRRAHERNKGATP